MEGWDRKAGDTPPLQVELFSLPGCRQCQKTARILEELAAGEETPPFRWRQLDVVEALDHAVELGVLATPAIVIGGCLVHTGAPSRGQLQRLITAAGAGNG
ncbi:MAG TPA: glutaredoxin [Sedimenticola sp.]|nr:glutaredoxin [Sedimenticola sp.]